MRLHLLSLCGRECEDIDVPPWARIKALIVDAEDLSRRKKNMNIKRAKQEIKDSI